MHTELLKPATVAAGLVATLLAATAVLGAAPAAEAAQVGSGSVPAKVLSECNHDPGYDASHDPNACDYWHGAGNAMPDPAKAVPAKAEKPKVKVKAKVKKKH